MFFTAICSFVFSQQKYNINKPIDNINLSLEKESENSDLREFKFGAMFNILGQAPSIASISIDFFPVKYVSLEGGYGATGIFSFYGGGKLHLPFNQNLDLYSGVFVTNIEIPGFDSYTPLKTMYYPLGIEIILEHGFTFGGELGIIYITEDKLDNVDRDWYPWIGLKIGYHYRLKY
jgi:hypothetical protein